jgi:hypothetical protein
LLPIQRNECVAELFCHGDINCITAADPMLSGYPCSLLRHRPRYWEQFDHLRACKLPHNSVSQRRISHPSTKSGSDFSQQDDRGDN